MAEEANVELVASQDVGGRRDVDGAARVGVRGVAGYGDVLAWLYDGRVHEKGVDDSAQHDGAGRVRYEVSFVLHFVFGAEAFDFGLC